MAENFKKTTCEELSVNPFTAIGKDWMLVTAGDESKYNTMTASWGGLGVMWGKNAAFVFIRPQRYTLEFIEKNDYFSLCFFDEEYRSALSFCGSKSGRDFDKAKETGLAPCFDLDAPYFAQAKRVIICKKLYGQYLNAESSLSETVIKNYANNDYHEMFIAEIVDIFEK